MMLLDSVFAGTLTIAILYFGEMSGIIQHQD